MVAELVLENPKLVEVAKRSSEPSKGDVAKKDNEKSRKAAETSKQNAAETSKQNKDADEWDSRPSVESMYRPATESKRSPLSTGIRRLDDLLGGGYPAGSTTLLHGPPFCGKRRLQQAAFLAAARKGIPSVYVLHDLGAKTMSQKLREIDPEIAKAEKSGLVTYLDLYSPLLGRPSGHPCAVEVNDSKELPGLTLDVTEGKESPPGQVPRLLAIESASTLMVDEGSNRMFALLRSMLGQAVDDGGVALACLEAGMHTDQEVLLVKHLATGMIDLRIRGERRLFHIEGLETQYDQPGWVEYALSGRSFSVTGGFATRSIA